MSTDSKLKVPLIRLNLGDTSALPSYKTEDSAGSDLAAFLAEPVTLNPRCRLLVPTGIAIALPQGYEAQIRSRSGLALNYGIVVFNAPGTIDADYRGELKVLLMNHSENSFEIQPGMRIAQLIIAPVIQVEWQERKDLPQSSGRGEKGFGSTGLV